MPVVGKKKKKKYSTKKSNGRSRSLERNIWINLEEQLQKFNGLLSSL